MPILRKRREELGLFKVDGSGVPDPSDEAIARQAAEGPDLASIDGDLEGKLARGEEWLVVARSDPRAVRERLGLGQGAFARMFGVSARTLRNGEQRRRRPGPCGA